MLSLYAMALQKSHTASPPAKKEANVPQLTFHASDDFTLEPGEDDLWESRIRKINQEIEERKAAVAMQSFTEYDTEIFETQTAQLYDALLQTAKRHMSLLQKFNESWRANIYRQLGETRGHEFVKKSRATEIQQQVVHAMERLGCVLILKEPPSEDAIRKVLLYPQIPERPSSSKSTVQTEPLQIKTFSLPTTPDRGGPTGVKRKLEVPDKNVSTNGLSPPLKSSQVQFGKVSVAVNPSLPKKPRVSTPAQPLRPVQHPDRNGRTG